MAKINGKRLYEVRLINGAKNPNYMRYYETVLHYNPKSIDLQGGAHHALVAHHMDPDTVHLLLTDGFKKGTKDTLEVTEITRKSLKRGHQTFHDLVHNMFLPYDFYPNIEE